VARQKYGQQDAFDKLFVHAQEAIDKLFVHAQEAIDKLFVHAHAYPGKREDDSDRDEHCQEYFWIDANVRSSLRRIVLTEQ
jgi:hypothetical protein